MATRTTGPASGGTGFTTDTAWTETAIDKLPGGLAAYVTNAGASGITTAATYGEVTFTTIDDRLYLVEVDTAIEIETNSGTTAATVSITNSANTQLQSRELNVTDNSQTVPIVVRYLATGNGSSQTFKCRVNREVGSGTVNLDDVLLTVTDMGPQF